MMADTANLLCGSSHSLSVLQITEEI